MRRATAFGAFAVALASTAALGMGGGAADTITIRARPAIVKWNDVVVLNGSVQNATGGNTVTIQEQLCGQKTWQTTVATRTNGTEWTATVFPGVNELLRATANGSTSAPIRVQQRPAVQLVRRQGQFQVSVGGRTSLWHRRVTLQRFDRSARVWRDVRSALLTDSGAAPGSTYVWSSTEPFRQKLAKGTLVRATVPLSQVRPCYLGGYSNLLTS